MLLFCLTGHKDRRRQSAAVVEGFLAPVMLARVVMRIQALSSGVR